MRHQDRRVAEPDSEISLLETPLGGEAGARDAPFPFVLPSLRRLRGADERSEASGAVVVRDRDAVYRRVLAAVDVTAAALALVAALVVLGGDPVLLGAIVAAPLIVLVGKVAGLYDRDEHLLRKTTLDEGPALLQVATLFALLASLGDDYLQVGGLDKPQVVALWGLLLLFMVAGRALGRRAVGVVVPEERCLILGDESAVTDVNRKFEANPALRAVIVGRLALQPGYRRAEDVARLRAVIEEQEIHRVMIAPRSGASESMLDAIKLVKSLGVKVSVLPRLFEVVGSSVKFDDLDGLTVLGVPRYGLTKSSARLKRAVDIAGAATLLTALAPLLLAIAITIRASSRGPALFRQPRIGRDGAGFEIIKFRSMVDGADARKDELRTLNEAEGLFKIAADPRVTRVGRVLRRFSLDELPQLLNVLAGDMSLVGPRPLVPDEDCHVEGWHRRRLHLQPGMTGMWQILGPSRIPLNEMVKIDYLYGANWSLWLDMKVLLRTCLYVFSRQGM